MLVLDVPQGMVDRLPSMQDILSSTVELLSPTQAETLGHPQPLECVPWVIDVKECKFQKMELLLMWQGAVPKHGNLGGDALVLTLLGFLKA